MKRTLTLPDGRTLATTSTKRYHLVTINPRTGGLLRYTSSAFRGRIIAAHTEVTHVHHRDAWIVDTDPEARATW